MPRLIINADDFGLTSGINRAIVDLHRAGALTSATLMAGATRFDEAVALARENPSLDVGCHVVLVDGAPVAAPESIPSLLALGSPSHFRPALSSFIRDLYLHRIDPTHIEREATSQIRRLQNAGIHVTHIDTHKHTHMFPPILHAVTQAAKTCGIHAIRNPFEPAWSVAATPNAGMSRKFQVTLLRQFQRHFLAYVHRQSLVTTSGCLGVLATGTLDAPALQAILARLPESGTWEIVCHPGYLDDSLQSVPTRLKTSRPIEAAALEAVFTARRMSGHDDALTNFAHLA